jgi:hypothetical protein
MSIQSLKRRANELASDARRLRSERNEHALEGLAILRRRLGSPAGLALSFGAGVVAGSAAPRRRPFQADEDGKDRAGKRNKAHAAGPGFADWLLRGPLGVAAFKLAPAFIAGAMMQSDGTE